jgi:hypothetical protein
MTIPYWPSVGDLVSLDWMELQRLLGIPWTATLHKKIELGARFECAWAGAYTVYWVGTESDVLPTTTREPPILTETYEGEPVQFWYGLAVQKGNPLYVAVRWHPQFGRHEAILALERPHTPPQLKAAYRGRELLRLVIKRRHGPAEETPEEARERLRNAVYQGMIAKFKPPLERELGESYIKGLTLKKLGTLPGMDSNAWRVVERADIGGMPGLKAAARQWLPSWLN